MEFRATGWVPDYPDQRDYTLDKLVEEGGFRIVESLETRENDIIGLLLAVAKAKPDSVEDSKEEDPEEKNYSFLRGKLDHYYRSTLALRQAKYTESGEYNSLVKHKNFSHWPLPENYVRTFCNMVFVQTWRCLEDLEKENQKEKFKESFEKLATEFYPLINLSVYLASPINKFNSRRKNISYLVEILRVLVAFAYQKEVNGISHITSNNASDQSPFSDGELDLLHGIQSSSTYPDLQKLLLYLHREICEGETGNILDQISNIIWSTFAHKYQSSYSCNFSDKIKLDIIEFILTSLERFDLRIKLGLIDKKRLTENITACLRKDRNNGLNDQDAEGMKGVSCIAFNPFEFEFNASMNPGNITDSDKEKHEEIKDASEKHKVDTRVLVPFLRRELDEYRSGCEEGGNKVCVLCLPRAVDLSPWCSAVENQRNLESCSAHVAVGLVEYFQKRSGQDYQESSRLFLYKVTRDLMRVTGNVGTSLRETMKAMVLFGTPPEKYWPYDEKKLDISPDNFCFAYAQNYQALRYFRLDPVGTSNNARQSLLHQVKVLLASGFPCAFGFTLYQSSYQESLECGNIPLPCVGDTDQGGHALIAVGYSDDRVMLNADGEMSKGALLIRNSWGVDWGDHGYGWLPFAYVTRGLTSDWWSLVKAEWLNTAQFGFGTNLFGSDSVDKQNGVG